jgi:hypothetical protein
MPIDFRLLQPLPFAPGKVTSLDQQEQRAKINNYNASAASSLMDSQTSQYNAETARMNASANLASGGGGGNRSRVASGNGGDSGAGLNDAMKAQQYQDFLALRQASSQSLDAYEATLQKIDPMKAMEYSGKKQQLQANLLDMYNKQRDSESDRTFKNKEYDLRDREMSLKERTMTEEEAKNSIDRISSLGAMSLFVDNLVQKTGDKDLYKPFVPILKQIDKDVPQEYNRPYIAAAIAAANPTSQAIRNNPQLAQAIFEGGRQQAITKLLGTMSTNGGQLLSDYIKFQMIPGQAGQIGKATLYNQLQGFLQNTGVENQLKQIQLEEAKKKLSDPNGVQDKAPTGYRWGALDSSGNPTLEAIPGGPAQELNAEQAVKLQFLRQAQTSANKINDLVFKQDGSINRAALFSNTLGIPRSEGREIRSNMFMGVDSALRGMMGSRYNKEASEMYYKHFMPNNTDTDGQIREKLQSYNDFVTGSLKLLEGSKFPNGPQERAATMESNLLEQRRQQALARGVNPLLVDKIYQQQKALIASKYKNVQD